MLRRGAFFTWWEVVEDVEIQCHNPGLSALVFVLQVQQQTAQQYPKLNCVIRSWQITEWMS